MIRRARRDGTGLGLIFLDLDDLKASTIVSALSPLNNGIRRPRPRFETPSRLARRLGWLTTTQLRSLLIERRSGGRRFDEINRERGLRSDDRLAVLLALQLEPPEPLADSLVQRGVVGEAAMHAKLSDHYQCLRTPLDGVCPGERRGVSPPV